MGNEKINQLDSFTYLGNNISKDGGCREDVKSRVAEAQDIFLQLKKVWNNRKINLAPRLEQWMLQ